jgi:mannitol operon transcriptional antiterminator
MAIGYLNERTGKILRMILNASSELPLKAIAEELALSTRTIYNEMDKTNDWLRSEKLHPFTVNRGKVQLLSTEERQALESVLSERDEKEDYIFTPTERVRMIICYIIIAQTPVYIEELMDVCLVSRNTIFTDLQAIVTLLRGYGLSLVYEKRTGYRVEGDAVRVRAIFFLYFNMLQSLLASGKLVFIHMDELSAGLQRLTAIEQAMNVHYIKDDMVALAAMLPVMQRGGDALYFADMSAEKIEKSREFQLVVENFPELSGQEQLYLALHFLGARLNSYSRFDPDEKPDETTLVITKNLVSEFERRACVEFDRPEELIHDLYLHIRSSMYRYQFGIQIGNPMADDVEREYPDLFDLTRAVSGYLEQQIGVQISDSEVAFLALHFGAHLELSKPKEKRLRILVVCVNGIATANMIRQELAGMLPSADLVGIKAVSELRNPQNDCDLIVSSVKLEAVVPVIVVNPVMNDFDRRNIMNHPLIRGMAGFVDVDALFRAIRQYVPDGKQDLLRRELNAFFSSEYTASQPVMNAAVWRLSDFLSEDRVVFIDQDGSISGHQKQADDMEPWMKALYSAGTPLIERGSIYQNYIRHIIERLKESGPYMFVTNELILAHARPENGVRHLDLSIGIVREGIPFGKGKTARVILLLSPKDQQKHMGILRDIRKIFRNAGMVESLLKAKSAAQVCSILRDALADQ